jgi:hypothetical protein
MRVKIEVTADDIRLGQRATKKPRDYTCPVARALRRALPGNEVSVTNLFCVINCRNIPHSGKVEAFVTMADTAKLLAKKDIILKPFSFTINVPKEYVA